MSRAFFSDLLSSIVDRGRVLLGRPKGGIASLTREASLTELCEALLSKRGEASGTAIAGEILDRYADLKEDARLAFFETLANEFGPDHRKMEKSIKAWHDNPANETSTDLHFSSEPRRQELFRRLNRTTGGTVALVRMREQLLEQLPSRPTLGPVNRDLAHLFSSWFNRGFLVLKPIDWTTPVNILEKIIQYEAVHAIQNWDDLRNRLKPIDRRCFAYFHPQLIDEPLIFVEVALTRIIPRTISSLLESNRAPIPAQDATIAVFYSISNTQKGLAGISFGNFLIKQVVSELQQTLPHLKTYVTLSPIVNFASWLKLERSKEMSVWLQASDKKVLAYLDQTGWHNDALRCKAIKKVLMPIAASYFLKARASTGGHLDAVARFHLGNGARLEQLNFLGDKSPHGLQQSHGLMVNYCYVLEDIEKNHEAFTEGGIVVTSPLVQEQVHAELFA